MIKPHFKLNKTLQAIGVVLKETSSGRTANIINVLKTLYYADRMSLLERGFTITGDQPVAMERGPVLSHVYDFHKGRGKPSELAAYRQYFASMLEHNVLMNEDPGTELLTAKEISIIQKAYSEVPRNQWETSEWSHKMFPEWEKAYEVAQKENRLKEDISIESIATELGLADEIEFIEEAMAEDEVDAALKVA